jgi:hypothetical protein
MAAHLPELTRDLGRQGFGAETWTPASAGTQGERLPTAKEPSGHADTRDSWRQQNERQQDPDQRRKQAPQDDFEEYLW